MNSNSQRHFILNKPYGYISQFISNDARAHKKKFLGELHSFPEGTMPIGRLDEKSEGLLLLTTDGRLSDFINSNKIEKEYYVQVDGVITNKAIEKLRNGVEIGLHGKKYITKQSEARQIDTPTLQNRKKKIRDDRHGPTSWVSITLTEGKFRQVRKMTAAVGFATLRLVRVRIGLNLLEGLEVGEAKEVNSLV